MPTDYSKTKPIHPKFGGRLLRLGDVIETIHPEIKGVVTDIDWVGGFTGAWIHIRTKPNIHIRPYEVTSVNGKQVKHGKN